MTRTLSYDAWLAEGRKRFGKDGTKWKFKCPSCGVETTVQEWRDAGAPEGQIAFSCVGRSKGASGATKSGLGAPGPCNYAGGGLFRLNPVTVTDFGEEGATHQVFEFAGAEREQSGSEEGVE